MSWVDHARQQGGNKQAAGPLGQVQPALEELDRKFRLACEQDLRASVAKLKLYLEDERTISVLVARIQDKIVGDYETFKDVARSVQAGSLRDVVLSQTKLKDILNSVCEGQVDT
jgi:hypothetical protein